MFVFCVKGIKPETHSPGMFSWFPILFPLKVSHKDKKRFCKFEEHIPVCIRSSTQILPPDSNPSPYPTMRMSQCASGAATTGRRCGMNGPWPSPPAPPSTILLDGPTPLACNHDTHVPVKIDGRVSWGSHLFSLFCFFKLNIWCCVTKVQCCVLKLPLLGTFESANKNSCWINQIFSVCFWEMCSSGTDITCTQSVLTAVRSGQTPTHLFVSLSLSPGLFWP